MKAAPPFRILCVDDNHDCADSTVTLLRVSGFDARACYDGPTALKMAEEFHPSVCLVDLNMAGMDGDEVAKNMRRHAWCPPMLVSLTASSDEESRQRTSLAGFQLHMVKPIAPEDLLCVVDVLCRQASIHEASTDAASRASYHDPSDSRA
jgi:CheY-like chemotaxis protein